MSRYGFKWLTLKFLLLRFSQARTFRRSDGVIFLTEYAKRIVSSAIGCTFSSSAVIPHGINGRFFRTPRRQRHTSEFSAAKPCKIVYCSSVDVYKHQSTVVEAVSMLRSNGIFVSLELVGPPQSSISTLRDTINRIDPTNVFISYLGNLPYDSIDQIYEHADINVFASSCENMPNILLEAMAAGVPTACSNRGPMPAILKDAGVYFDPENPSEIYRALMTMINSTELRADLAYSAFKLAHNYDWQRSSKDVFSFLRRIGNGTCLEHQ